MLSSVAPTTSPTRLGAPPPEWAEQRAIWTAFPAAADLWEEKLLPAQEEVAALVNALVDKGFVELLVDGLEALDVAKRLTDAAKVKLYKAKYGDIWLRDTGPVFARNGVQAGAHLFRFNGWGCKYVLEGDAEIGAFVARAAGVQTQSHDFILEGGAIDGDGEGTVLTTRQCLLNPNRNAGWTQEKAEKALARVGFTKVLWLDEGLLNDHTDGHVDNIARFVAPGTVVCQSASGTDDPNAQVLKNIETALRGMRDAKGRALKVITIPSPGRVELDGEIVPASHMNFIIANGKVVVPEYNALAEKAVDALAPLFPDRKVISLSSRALLAGGGSFHCITQQEPML